MQEKKIEEKPLQVVGLPNGFVGELQKNGTWFYKAKNIATSLLSNKKSEYKDKPQYPIIETVESKMKQDGRRCIENIGIDIVKFLNKL